MQFGRLFAGFQYQTGVQADGQTHLITVPVHMAITDRMVATIIQNNSQNTLQTAPQITFFLRDFDVARERTAPASYVETKQIYERKFDPNTQKYTSEVGNTYSLDRTMATPFNLTIQVDIWTTNQLQKDQLLEQIITLFNPSIDLNSDTNVFDWTALTFIELETIVYRSQTIPVGLDNQIDISTLTFKVPFWLSPPAKLKKMTIIEQIVANIGDMYNMEEGGLGKGTEIDWDVQDLLARIIVTPGDMMVRVQGNIITLLNSDGSDINEFGDPYDWLPLLNKYGQIRPSISQLRLKTTPDLDDSTHDIIGFIQINPAASNQLLWSINATTLPTNTLGPINGIINPHSVWPGNGLPPAVTGQRYLLTDSVGNDVAWGTISGERNDIIQYSGTAWTIAFTAKNTTAVQYLLNNNTGKQLKWNGEQWIMAVDGTYRPGFWRIFL